MTASTAAALRYSNGKLAAQSQTSYVTETYCGGLRLTGVQRARSILLVGSTRVVGSEPSGADLEGILPGG